MTRQTVIKIIAEHLTANGYSGLVAPGAECGCELGDLHPCGETFAQCEPGYKHCDPRDSRVWGIFVSKDAPSLEAFDALDC